jgi:hypothetical protein
MSAREVTWHRRNVLHSVGFVARPLDVAATSTK